MADHIETGLRGEETAAAYLAACGWQIVRQRWRDGDSGGLRTDIDLVARSSDGTYHFVEVKTRSGRAAGDFSPEAAVTPAKACRMVQAAERYMAAEKLDGEISVDLVAVIADERSGNPEIRYYPDIAR